MYVMQKMLTILNIPVTGIPQLSLENSLNSYQIGYSKIR
jgi:hypothetical protein